MDLNKISGKVKWYLSEISASISSHENIAIIDLNTINRYNLNPGYYVRIQDIDNHKSEEKFILLPYLETNARIRKFLQNLLNELERCQFRKKPDLSYTNELNQIISYFNKAKSDSKRIRFLDLDLEIRPNKNSRETFRIGLPGYWLDENNIGLGDLVLLRNDYPSPIAF